MRHILRLFWKQLFSGVLTRYQEDTLSDPFFIARLKSVVVLSVVGIAALVFFGVLNLVDHSRVAGYFELIAATALMANLLAMTRWGKIELATNISLCILVPLILYLVYTGGIAGSGAMWLFVLPPAAFYLTGLRWGLVWMGLTAVGLALLVHSQMSGFLMTAYDDVFLRQLSLCLLVVAIIIFYHQKVGDTARKIAMESNLQQEKLSQQLKAGSQDMEEARIRYHALMESIGDGIIATDRDGRVVLVNQAALELLKMKKSDLIGKTVEAFRVEDEKGNKIPYEHRIVIKVLKTNKKVTTDINSHYYYVDTTGRRFPVASTQTPIIINGENQGAVLVFRDMTLEKQLDAAKTELISLASHQLNTPLTAINWYAEILLSGEAGELQKGQRQYLEEISVSGAKMADIISDFLNASRIEMGTFVPQDNEINIIDVAEEVLSELSPSTNRKELAIVKNFAKLGQIKMDKRLIQIILQNLLSNSVKYTPEKGSITLTIKREGSSHARSLLISVADNGMGIPKSEQPHIFTKMYRAHNAEKMVGEGTGLGLYIVKSAVSQLHGSIKLESDEGKGTTFTVKLPLQQPRLPDSASVLHKRG